MSPMASVLEGLTDAPPVADGQQAEVAQASTGVQMMAEVIGTYLLCVLGPGSVAVAVMIGGMQGSWEVASVWAFAIAMAIYATGAISGCHINPAVTIALAVFRPREFAARKVLPYISAQFLGGVLAALTLLAIFGQTCVHFEAVHHLVRGQAGSQLSAMWFGAYFPNPAAYGTGPEAWAQVPLSAAFAAEALGTALLLFFIFALTDKHSDLAVCTVRLRPWLIGLTVGVIICLIGPLTQSELNPARDFAPRVVAYFAGWGSIAIPGPRGCEWWLYIVAPTLGGLLGAGVYQFLARACRKCGAGGCGCE